MTDEIFEKAVEIREKINTISILQGVLANSKDNGCGDKHLAAIDAKKINGFCVEDCEVLNHVRVPEDVMERLEAILCEEYHKASNAFKAL